MSMQHAAQACALNARKPAQDTSNHASPPENDLENYGESGDTEEGGYIIMSKNRHTTFSFVVGESEPVVQRGRVVPKLLPFVVAVVCVVLTSCTDPAALSAKLAAEGYLDKNGVSAASRGANQIASWGTVLIFALLPHTGPRLMAALGGFSALASSMLMIGLSNPADENVVMWAWALQKLGGACMFTSSLTFTNLMPHRQALLDGISGAATTASGLITLPLINAGSVSMKLYFTVLIPISSIALLLAIVFYPDMPYERGDRAVMALPSLQRKRYSSDASQYLRALCGARFVGFLVTTCWTVTIGLWYGGAVFEMKSDSAPEGYFAWGMSFSDGLAMVSAPTVGALIDLTYDRTGYAVSGVFQLLLTIAVLLALFSSDSAVMWAILPGLAFMKSFTYMTLNSYVQRCYPADALPFLLMLTHFCSSVVGLLNYPVLARNPWGENYTPEILIWLVLLFPMFVWPLLEWLRVGQPRRAGRGSELHKLLSWQADDAQTCSLSGSANGSYQAENI